MTQKDKLIIFDTTLRDGEQSPGVTLSADEKVEIARHLSRMGVDVCEAGFPVASQGDFEAVERIAKQVGPLMEGRKQPMRIAALARAVPSDIQRAFDAIRHAPLHRIHTFLATSDVHLKYKLKLTREECIKKAVDAIKFAKSIGCQDVEFSPEDAGRSDKDFLCQVLGAVIEAGATTLNIPDTVGYNTPEEYGDLIRYLVQHTPHADRVVFSCHCHNDLGLATANTLAGVVAGARQVEVTINGIGERAGNTSLEEIVMVLYTHPSTYPVYCDILPAHIYPTSQLVIKLTGMPVQPNKAIVGANAFAHESGIHQDGVLKYKGTYEIIAPEVVGVTSNNLVLGKHSGRNAFRNRIEHLLKASDSTSMLEKLNDAQVFDSLFAQFKKLADTKKKGISDIDLLALVDEHVGISRQGLKESFQLESVQVVSGSNVMSTATLALMDVRQAERCVLTDAAIGYGPVHAIFGAINRIVGTQNVLAYYSVSAVTEGSDALGRVMVRIHPQEGSDTTQTPLLMEPSDTQDHGLLNDKTSSKTMFLGQGTDEDILVASAKAYVNAINRMLDYSSKMYPVATIEKRVDV